MIVTRSWLNEWVDISKVPTKELLSALNSIGLEVGSIRSYQVPKGVVFGKVVECIKHPEADKLSLCQVDIGRGTNLQIVCGASNVRADLFVAVATVGTTMIDGLKIKPVKLRGVESDGMICSAKELGLDSLNDGIMELDDSIGKFNLGDDIFTKELFSDEIIEIELTPNRGDCLSIRGVARDLAAVLDKNIKEFSRAESEDARVGIGRIATLSYDDTTKVDLKYKALDLKDVRVPFLISFRLAQIESKFSSKIDAFIAYATHSSGVILKAYDYSFFATKEKEVAKIILSNDENSFASIYNKTNTKASSVGVMQEDASRCSDDSSIVLLEASYVAPESISVKMQEHKIASNYDFYRASRGSEPNLSLGIDVCTHLLETFSSSNPYGGSIDHIQNTQERIISVTKSQIESVIGVKLDKAKLTKIFKNLGFGTEKSSSENFILVVPPHRHDIQNLQDIAEEVVRIIGIDKIASSAFVFSEENRLQSDYFEYKKRYLYRHKAAQNGFFESIHFAFDERKKLLEYGFRTIDEELDLLNPIVNTLDTLRTTLLHHLLKSASFNANNGYDSIRLFEVGLVFDSKKEESYKLAFIFSGNKDEISLSNKAKPAKVDFDYFTQKLSDIIGSFKLSEHKSTHKLAHPYICAKICLDNEVVGEVFKLHPNIAKELDLDDTFMCELDFEKLPFEIKKATQKSKFQVSYRDLSLFVPDDINYETISLAIDKAKSQEVERYFAIDKYKDTSMGANSSLTIRFALRSNEKTLTESEISQNIDTILEALKNELGVGLR